MISFSKQIYSYIQSHRSRQMYRIFLLIFLIQLPGFLSLAQNQQELFPGKKGTELLSLIVSSYKPSSTLSYNDARDELWGALAERKQDSLACVYTGYTIFVDPAASNPRTEAYNKGINCEHSWPQSLGAEGQAKSDMHHLFPSREDVNAARANFAFQDIDDQLTDKWYWLDQQKSSIPATAINQYSELDNNKWFEVREDHKGNAARAMVYFYCMYKSLADAKDPSFFSKQIETLYQWHYMDPVDVDEEWRNNFIASKQGENPNPFILDSTLVRRAYFPDYKGSSGSGISSSPGEFNMYTKHSANTLDIVFENELHDFKVKLYNLYGQNVKSYHFKNRQKTFSISTVGLAETIYLVEISGKNFVLIRKVFLSE